jgi:hypothetical protein
MKKKSLYNALGTRFYSFLKTHDYPSLGANAFSEKDCTVIRSNFYGMSHENTKLREQLITLLHKGIIEEIRDEGKEHFFLLMINYRQDQYLAEMSFVNYDWRFESLHFVGEVPQNKKPFIYVSTILLCTIILFSVYWFGFSGDDGQLDETPQRVLGETTDEGLALQAEQTAVHILEDESKAEISHQGNLVNIDADSHATGVTDITNSESNIMDKADIHHELASLSPEQLQQLPLMQDYIVITKEDFAEMLRIIEQAHATRPLTNKISTESGLSEDNLISFTIAPGMRSSEVSSLLFDLQLIPSRQEFLDLLTAYNLHRMIFAETYTVPSDISYFELIKRITPME